MKGPDASKQTTDNERAGVSIAIEQRFDAAQPNHFYAEPARAVTYCSGEFVADTRRGGSCNVQQVHITPHCNGTHTESISHIVDELLPPWSMIKRPLLRARLISVHARPAGQCQDSYTPALQAEDRVIDAAALAAHDVQGFFDALIVRTVPNGANKTTRQYTAEDPPAFFTSEAMQHIDALGVDHLLVDLPSVDRMHDEGRLSNHRIFWHLPEHGHALVADAQVQRTITEMIHVPECLADGVYLLNLQMPAWRLDAVPSNPLLYQPEPQ